MTMSIGKYWDSHDRHSLAAFVLESKMILTPSEKRLIDKLQDEYIAFVSVYDLMEANCLCYQAIGWMKAQQGA